MELGGVLLGAGMELNLAPGTYLYGEGAVQFLIEQIVETRREWDTDWVIMTGMERPTPVRPWRPRRIQVRVSALKGSLVLT